MKTVTGRIKEQRYIEKLLKHGIRYSVFKPSSFEVPIVEIDLAEAERRVAAFLRGKPERR